jgi:hypothetical protein
MVLHQERSFNVSAVECITEMFWTSSCCHNKKGKKKLQHGTNFQREDDGRVMEQ